MFSLSIVKLFLSTKFAYTLDLYSFSNNNYWLSPLTSSLTGHLQSKQTGSGKERYYLPRPRASQIHWHFVVGRIMCALLFKINEEK